jgi:hypothetical protein
VKGFWLTIALAIALTLSALGAPGHRATAQTPVDENVFLQLMPDLRSAPAPGWLKAGMRLSYYSAAASVRGARHYYTQDPNGNWVDPQTGQKYSQGEVASASGHGFTQLTVVYVDQSVAVVDSRSYGLTNLNGPLVLLSSTGFVGVPGAGGDFWLHPQALAKAVGLRGQGLAVLRMPYTIEGRQFRAIRFESRGETSYASWVFDEDTGILLRSGTSTQGAPMQGPVAQGDSRGGNTLLTQNTVRDAHAINVPWMFGAAPAWVAQSRLLRFDGKYTMRVPGNPRVSIPFAATFERQFSASSWARYVFRVYSQAENTEVVRVYGSAQIGGLWISPDAVGQLRAGQVLDNDPITGVVATVSQVTRTSQGVEVVVITEEGSGLRLDYAYDRRDGGMLYYSQIDKVLNTQGELFLVQRR